MEICYIMNKEETLSNLKAYLDGEILIKDKLLWTNQ